MESDIRIRRVDPGTVEDLKIIAAENGYVNYQDLLRSEIEILRKNRQLSSDSFDKFSKRLSELQSEILKSNAENKKLLGQVIELLAENFGI
ncbi:MAG: hypothetical protein LBT37_06155 [Lactobacillaceae bacterium]|jgi:hypothetical protein|nr:hypothetical protein [Lactobacillaceae bacterium]